ncbi:MAG: peptidoglycan-binding protein [Clostridia bacterium]|nr:peptidoglycan-binding protein [Clostridia bacterium]
MKACKRIISVVLVFCLMLSLMPFAFAEVLYKEGDSSEEVKKIKDRMFDLGYYNTKSSHNQFNATMTERVKLLQKMNDLEQTGVIDEELYALIFSDACRDKNGRIQGELRQGDNNDRVLALKKRMQELLYFNYGVSMSSSYNTTMTERVKQLQKVNGLEETGIVTKELYDFIMSDNCLNKNGKLSGMMVEGDSSSKIRELKLRMQELLYFDPDASMGNAFNETMTQRVKLLQETNGFEPTGVVSKELYNFIMSDDCLKCGDWHDPYYQVEARENYALDGEKLFSLSESGNVVVFVIDYFANNYMKSLLRAYPNIMDEFKDFTFYTNCDPRYIGTYPSITHMLTGAEFDPSLMVAEWFQQAWSSDKANYLYDTIHSLGYEFRYYYYSAISNGMKAEAVGKVDNLIDLTVEGAKSPEPIYSYANFMEQLQKRGLTKDQTDKKYIQMIHLRGAHAPYTVDANGNEKEDASRDENIAGYLKMIKTYMEEMKRLGLYDDATIIVTADHGDKDANMQVVYFIKEAGETHEEMAENAAPISHDDFPGTLLHVIGGDYSQYGTSIYDWSEDDKRERTCSVVGRDANVYPLGSSYSDKGIGSHNLWKTYTYTGDGDDLVKIQKRNKYSHVQLKQSFN